MSTPSKPTTPGANPSSTPSTPPQEESTTASLLRRFPTEKITSFIRLKTQRRPPIVFPPPSWNLEDTVNNGAGASGTPSPAAGHQDSSDDQAELDADPEPEDLPEPHVLAERIGTLIDGLPPPATTKPADVGVVDPKGPPLPQNVAADKPLMKLLASESVMNGSITRGRQSVWAMLEKLQNVGRRSEPLSSPAEAEKKEGGIGQAEENHEHDREEGGMMVYAPLEPTAESQVELAESETVLEYADEPTAEDKSRTTPTEAPASELKPPPSPTPSPKPDESASVKKPETASLKPAVSVKRRKDKVHWIPSRTQISLQVTWWGYRLYLPPPVMKKLDGAHISAAKRGAMLVASLKWLLGRVPVMMLPPQLRPAMTLLKRLTPYLGYVGVFVAWSWKAIKERDKGHGVVLMATWLLPVALLPSSLKPEDFRRPGDVLQVPKDAAEAPDSAGSAQRVPSQGNTTAKGSGTEAGVKAAPSNTKGGKVRPDSGSTKI